ncbi:hypothetical protein [Rhizobium laguerreae]|uniref:hypothetical protein n=1 Tax=Rhizobium laguerreae TaxID=1076926 RepID=UPI0035E429E4
MHRRCDPSGLLRLVFLVAVEFQQFDHHAEIGHRVVIGIAPVAAVEFATLEQAVALVFQIAVSLGEVLRLKGDVVAAWAYLLQQIAPGALFRTGLQELDVDIAGREPA